MNNTYDRAVSQILEIARLIVEHPERISAHFTQSCVRDQIFYWKLDRDGYARIDVGKGEIREVMFVDHLDPGKTFSVNELIVVGNSIIKFTTTWINIDTAPLLHKVWLKTTTSVSYLRNLILTGKRVTGRVANEMETTLAVSYEFYLGYYVQALKTSGYLSERGSCIVDLEDGTYLSFQPEGNGKHSLDLTEKVAGGYYVSKYATITQKRDILRKVLDS